MAYTVKKLAQLSGISVRALRWYDEVELLKPAYYGENGYRYYEEEQFLRLQQILFYRELDFPLDEIRVILGGNDFDIVSALNRHKKSLLKGLDRAEQLIETIDKTLLHIQGKTIMKYQEFYTGFDSDRLEAYEKELKGILKEKNIEGTEALFDESKKRASKWKKEDWERIKSDGEAFYQDLADAIEKGLSTSSPEVQAIVKLHYDWINNFYTPTKEVYIGIADLYVEHEGFREYLNKSHPKLAKFLAEAMKFFAESWEEIE
jgi:DNA-binding transcriptional MerR regulator